MDKLPSNLQSLKELKEQKEQELKRLEEAVNQAETILKETKSNSADDNNHPSLLDRVQGMTIPDPGDYRYYEDISRRFLRISTNIDDGDLYIVYRILEWNMEDALHGLKPEDRQPIILWIFSQGGDLTTAFSICDAIKKSVTPIIAINLGICYSAAALIFSCCSIRYGFPHSAFLLHEGWAVSGQATFRQHNSFQKNYDYQVKQMKEILKSNLDLHDPDKEKIFNKNMGDEWFLYCDQDEPSEDNAEYFGLINTKVFPLEGIKD